MINYIYLWFDQLAKECFLCAAILLSTLASIAISIIMTELGKNKRYLLAIITLVISLIIAEVSIAIIMSNYELH